MKKITKKNHFSPGQGIVEFALVIPILLTLMFGIFEFGRAFWIYSAVTSASREAARYGSSVSDNGSGTPYYLDCDGIRAAARRIGGPGQVIDSDISITYEEGPGGSVIGTCPINPLQVVLGNRVVVVVVGHFEPSSAIPFVDLPSIEFTSESRRTIIKNVNIESTAVAVP